MTEEEEAVFALYIDAVCLCNNAFTVLVRRRVVGKEVGKDVRCNIAWKCVRVRVCACECECFEWFLLRFMQLGGELECLFSAVSLL